MHRAITTAGLLPLVGFQLDHRTVEQWACARISETACVLVFDFKIDDRGKEMM
jgi:hypothetical protein